jgi:hypothetical protein
MTYLVVLDEPLEIGSAVEMLRSDHPEIESGLGGVEGGSSWTIFLSSDRVDITFDASGECVYIDAVREAAARFMEWLFRKVRVGDAVTIADDDYSFDVRMDVSVASGSIMNVLPG